MCDELAFPPSRREGEGLPAATAACPDPAARERDDGMPRSVSFSVTRRVNASLSALALACGSRITGAVSPLPVALVLPAVASASAAALAARF